MYKYFYWRIKRLVESSSIYVFDPDRLYWINPKSVKFRSKRARHMHEDLGKVMNGDWDLWNVTWDNHDEVRWLKERFTGGKRWEKTELYHCMLNYINTGTWNPPYDDNPNNVHFVIDRSLVKEDDDYFSDIFRTKLQLDKRCTELDNLYASIMTTGVVPMSEKINKIVDPWGAKDNIVIDIGRHGDLLFCDGKHRFTIANILELERIPVRIGKRHKLWVDFRNEIMTYLAKHGKVYQPLTHIDLVGFPSAHSTYRFDIIKKALEALQLNSGTLLDIGANWGYFSIKLEEMGFRCIAIENDPESLYFMRKLRRAENRNFKIVGADILSYNGNVNFDVVLALGIFHHLIKTESILNQLINFLGKVNMNIMFFQPSLKGKPNMRNSYCEFDPDEFVNFILKHSCLNNATHIGIETESGRPMFILSK